MGTFIMSLKGSLMHKFNVIKKKLTLFYFFYTHFIYFFIGKLVLYILCLKEGKRIMMFLLGILFSRDIGILYMSMFYSFGDLYNQTLFAFVILAFSCILFYFFNMVILQGTYTLTFILREFGLLIRKLQLVSTKFKDWSRKDVNMFSSIFLFYFYFYIYTCLFNERIYLFFVTNGYLNFYPFYF